MTTPHAAPHPFRTTNGPFDPNSPEAQALHRQLPIVLPRLLVDRGHLDRSGPVGPDLVITDFLDRGIAVTREMLDREVKSRLPLKQHKKVRLEGLPGVLVDREFNGLGQVVGYTFNRDEAVRT